MNEFLTNPQNLFYILSVFGLIIIVLILIVIRLSIKTKKLMSGKNGRSLEQSFMSMQKEIFELQNSRKSIEDYLKKVEKRLGTSIRGFENVTFDAFSGMASGGKSFSTAFVNEKKDGIIISCLNARDHIRIFSKKVTNGKTEVELSEEENLALTKAIESCSL
ncbi:DUF4446 family protein [Candidatus Parcubacteria bacterium]|nr:DUF4446 family protein [Candidatus Parcubacteria bacterium]